jgi:hypothetical protein
MGRRKSNERERRQGGKDAQETSNRSRRCGRGGSYELIRSWRRVLEGSGVLGDGEGDSDGGARGAGGDVEGAVHAVDTFSHAGDSDTG